MNTATAIAATIAALAVGVGWIALAKRRPGVAVVALAAYVCFSPHVLAIMAVAHVPVPLLRAGLAGKDALAWLLLATLAWQRRSERTTLMALGIVAVAAAVIASGWHGGAAQDARITSARDAIVPWLAIATGLLLTRTERASVAKALQWVIGLAAAYALIEYALPARFLTHVLHIGEFWRDVKRQGAFLVHINRAGGDLPGNFYTAPWTVSGGTRRLSGSFGDPLAAGYILAVGVAIGLTRIRRNAVEITLLVVTAAALLATFTRAAWIVALATVAAWLLGRVSRRTALVLVTLAVALGAVLVLASPLGSFVHDVVSTRSGSNTAHAQSLKANLHRHYTLFGSGLGTAGAAAAATGDKVTAVGTESGFATLLVEFGWLPGGLLLMGALVAAGCGVRSAWRSQSDRLWCGAVLGLLVTCLVSEELISFNGGWLPLVCAVIGAKGLIEQRASYEPPYGESLLMAHAVPEGPQANDRA